MILFFIIILIDKKAEMLSWGYCLSYPITALISEFISTDRIYTSKSTTMNTDFLKLFPKAHYDGEHIVLDEATDLKQGQKVVVLFEDGTVSEKRKSLLETLKTEHPGLTEDQRNEVADYDEFFSAKNDRAKMARAQDTILAGEN